MIQEPLAATERAGRPRVATAAVILVTQTSASVLSTTVPGTTLHGSDLVPIVIDVLGVVETALLLVLALVLRTGRGWARWVLAVLVLLSVPQVTDADGVGDAQGVLGVAAAALTFLPSTTAWLRSERDLRRSRAGFENRQAEPMRNTAAIVLTAAVTVLLTGCAGRGTTVAANVALQFPEFGSVLVAVSGSAIVTLLAVVVGVVDIVVLLLAIRAGRRGWAGRRWPMVVAVVLTGVLVVITVAVIGYTSVTLLGLAGAFG